MSRFYITLACIAFAAVCSAEHYEFEPLDADVQIVDDIEAFQAEYPDLKLTPLNVESIQEFNTIRYTYGSRAAGDRLITQGNNNLNYPRPQNARLNLNYPQSGGLGAVITFVEIVVDQTSNLGSAHIVSGGIGQRRISIVVEARNTLRLSYRAVFYGY